MEERSRSAVGERPRLRPVAGPPVAGQTRAVPGSTRQSPSSRPSTQLLAMEFGRGAGSSSRWSAAAAKGGRAEQSGAGATLGAVRAGPPAPGSADPVPAASQPRRVAPPLAAWRQRAAEPGRGRSRRFRAANLGRRLRLRGCGVESACPRRKKLTSESSGDERPCGNSVSDARRMDDGPEVALLVFGGHGSGR